MANLKSLAKDSAIYGLSSIVGRFLNYLLVPLYTRVFAAQGGEYGVVTELYSYVALILVLLTFGMETTFFRFVNKEGEQPARVYNTVLTLVGLVDALFVVLVAVFLTPLTDAMGYAAHPDFVMVMAVCVAVDAFLCMPFAYLRYQKKAMKFAAVKLANIGLNIGLNLVCFLLLPRMVDGFEAHVGYVFYINLFCTLVTALLLVRELSGFRPTLQRDTVRRMWAYAWPILILGLAGVLNQTADKIIFPRLVTGPEGKVQLGIYGACVKIAMIMAMITQAFRYAYEPFVFSRQGDKDVKADQARATKYFLIFTLLAFLTVTAYLDVLRLLISPGYWEGLRTVPIVMAAEILMGVYFNVAFWCKLTDRTLWNAVFAATGCAVLVGVNVWGIPRYGYMACAWGGVAGYGTALLLSYFVGQRYYPVRYPLGSAAVYVGLTALLFLVMSLVPSGWPLAARLGVNTLCLLAFAAHIVYHDLPVGLWKRNIRLK
ncbi:MAG: lipopolysaccharide biosynthesis protein [Bacteroidaceae bacterium]|nr:lipopolysaccharide biosynthesis protein [Bacteroidaceae bacterium]